LNSKAKKEDVKSKKDYTLSTKDAHPEKSRITLMDVDPYWLHTYWEITHKDKTRILKKSDESSHPHKKIIRVYDVSYIHFDGNNAHSYFDIEIDKDRGNWYINLWSPRKSFCAEIGVCSFEGNFYPIARSSTIDTPRPYQSSSDAEQWMKVTGDYREVVLLPEKTHTEKMEPKNTLLKLGKELPAPDLERDNLHSSKEKSPSKDVLSSTEKKYSSDITTTPTSSQSYKESTPSKKRVMENEIKDSSRKLRSGGRQQNKKSKTFPIIASHHKGGITQSEEDLPQRPFAERHVTYGSDTRWEKEVTRSANKERKKIITPEMIKKKIPSKMG
jgi:hypothetical protein